MVGPGCSRVATEAVKEAEPAEKVGLAMVAVMEMAVVAAVKAEIGVRPEASLEAVAATARVEEATAAVGVVATMVMVGAVATVVMVAMGCSA